MKQTITTDDNGNATAKGIGGVKVAISGLRPNTRYDFDTWIEGAQEMMRLGQCLNERLEVK